MHYQPTSTEIRRKRDVLGISQTKAAALCLVQLNTWARWERGDRKMPPPVWELLQYKALEIQHGIGKEQESQKGTEVLEGMLNTWED